MMKIADFHNFQSYFELTLASYPSIVKNLPVSDKLYRRPILSRDQVTKENERVEGTDMRNKKCTIKRERVSVCERESDRK